MRKLFLSGILLLLAIGCSQDDSSENKCEFCTSDFGTKFEMCDNGDKTYTYKANGEETGTISQSLLEEAGFSSAKEYIQRICEISTAEL